MDVQRKVIHDIDTLSTVRDMFDKNYTLEVDPTLDPNQPLVVNDKKISAQDIVQLIAIPSGATISIKPRLRDDSIVIRVDHLIHDEPQTMSIYKQTSN